MQHLHAPPPFSRSTLNGQNRLIRREKGKVVGRANCKYSKSELPLNVNYYYKIVAISEIFLIILEIQNRKLVRRNLLKV
jgi:hypothetical protein